MFNQYSDEIFLIDLSSLISLIILLFLVVFMVFCYLKMRIPLVMLTIWLFSFVLCLYAFNQTWGQNIDFFVFFILFILIIQTILIILVLVEVYEG